MVLAAGLLVGWVAAPGPAAACSGPMPTFEQLVSTSELIVEGRVAALLLDGLAYEIEVSEVFKGQVTGGRVRIGPTTDPGGRGCEITLEADGHVIIAVPDADEALNALGTAVWYVGTEGSLSSPGGWWTMAADAAELRDMLRDAIPDTALSPPKAARSYGILGWLLVYAAVALAGWRMMRRWRSLPGQIGPTEASCSFSGPSVSGELESSEQRDGQRTGNERSMS
jgi:hypothetical protein